MARAAASLCQALAERGHEVAVVTPRYDRSLPPQELRAGVRVHRLPSREPLERWLFPIGLGLGRFLGTPQAQADVVHLHGHRHGLAVAAARTLGSRPWVLQPHGTLPTHGRLSRLKRLLDRVVGDRVVAGAQLLVAVSEAEARDLPLPGRVRVVPNGVALPGVAASGSPPRGPALLFVGNDSLQKRGRLLPGLLQALPDVSLLLVGRFGPAFVSRLRRFGNRARFLGALSGDELARAYAAATLLVHPAVDEAFGLVAFEAALLGTPAVVAGGHGCGEWFSRAGGCVVLADHLPSLVDAVRTRLEEPGVGRDEAHRVAAYAGRELTWARAAAAMEAVYEEAAAIVKRGVA
jgi:glycosyltransferase involved in cell wall biosynthesis